MCSAHLTTDRRELADLKGKYLAGIKECCRLYGRVHEVAATKLHLATAAFISLVKPLRWELLPARTRSCRQRRLASGVHM